MVSVLGARVGDVERTRSTALLGAIDKRGGKKCSREGEYGSTQQEEQLLDKNGIDNARGRHQLPSSAAVGPVGGSPFPLGVVLLLALCMTLTMYSMVSLFPYVGMMVKELLRMEPTNGVGECG